MNNITLALAGLLLLSSRAFALNAVLPLSEAGFAHIVSEGVQPFQAKDAFREVGACGIVDAKFFRPFSVNETVAALKPCVEGLSAAYGTELKLKQVEGGLVIETGVTTLGSPLLRDLEAGLSSRSGQLLGHKVSVRRAMVPARQSRIQNVIDDCMKPMVIRKIENGADFLKVYAGCLAAEKAIKEVRPSPSHVLGLMVLTSEQSEVEALSGVVTVTALNGIVELQVVAFPGSLALP